MKLDRADRIGVLVISVLLVLMAFGVYAKVQIAEEKEHRMQRLEHRVKALEGSTATSEPL